MSVSESIKRGQRAAELLLRRFKRASPEERREMAEKILEALTNNDVPNEREFKGFGLQAAALQP